MSDFLQKDILQKIETSLTIKLIIFFLSIIIITLVYDRALHHYDPVDPLPELKIVDVEKRKELGTFVAKVNAGMFIKSFPAFDIAKNNFVVDLVLWFEYDPDRVMLETISQFSFENGEVIKKSQPDIRIDKDGQVLVKYDVRVSFRSNLSYKRYPLDDHRITLVLTNNFVTPAEVYFVVETTAFRTDPGLFIPDWKITDLSTDAGFLELGLEEKDASQVVAAPKARFTLRLEKKGVKDTFVIFVPLYLVTFIGLYSFLTSLYNPQTRYLMAASTVPALLSYRFVIQNLLPQVAYFTTTDYIYLLLLLIGFFIFVFQSIITRKTPPLITGENESVEDKMYYYFLFEKINFYVFILVTLVLIIGSCYFALI